MSKLSDVFSNYPLICALVSWIIAQVMKTIIWVIQNRKFNFVSLVASGGMPSSHSASVCALATAVGRLSGFNSVDFAISALLAFIVMYDAAGVRRSAGEQAKILNRIMEDIEHGITENMPKRLKELVGHTPLQVFAGAVLGILIGILLDVLLHYSQ
ncbi:MAG: divergent PAP2 family protein [Eubacteriales bacterium]|jgi:acid phosphatase family membrane protein YuiD|nr:divergent PAP2 family protein [Eubacteriales bacterium]